MRPTARVALQQLLQMFGVIAAPATQQQGQQGVQHGYHESSDDQRRQRWPVSAQRQRSQSGQRRGHVTVQLCAAMTEVGTLEMHCTQADDPAQRWLLAFQVRRHAGDDSAADSASAEDNAAHPRLTQAIALIERVFGATTPQQPVTAKEIRQLRSTLERLLGARDTWSIALLRTLFDALWSRARRRRRSCS